jgi:hypothetical protein
MYTEEDLVGIAQRENNNKRKYLVVNKLQGKHVPVVPSEAMKLFDSFAGIVYHTYQWEKLLLVGFAETATAIGAALATKMDCFYIQTTREVSRTYCAADTPRPWRSGASTSIPFTRAVVICCS